MRLKYRILLHLISIILFISLSLFFFTWIPDDAYISYCYARNLAAGNGFVFYPGEKVEGFSNFLWTLYLGGASSIGADIVRTAVITSLLFALGALFLMQWLIRATCLYTGVETIPTPIELAAVTIPAVFFPLIFYATSGLETSAALFFLVLGVLLHLEAKVNRRSSFHVAALFAFLGVSLLRPEGIIFLLISALFLLADRRALSKRKALLVALPFVLYAIFVAVKYLYFGSLLPNTYYAKPGASLHYLKPIPRGFGYLINFFTKSGLVLLLPLAVYSHKRPKAAYAWRYIWSLTLGQLAFIIFGGGDILRFDRFTLPFFPLLLAATCMAFVELTRNHELASQTATELPGNAAGSNHKMQHGRRSPLHKIIKRTALASLIIICGLNLAQIPIAKGKYRFHDWMHAHIQKETGVMLAGTLPAHSSIVTNEVGAFAYYSGLAVIDMIGLTDRTIARILYESYMTYGVGGSEWSVKEITKYLLSRKPECIVIPAYRPLSLTDIDANRDRMHLLWHTILADKTFLDEYRFLTFIEVHAMKYLYIFIAKGITPKTELPDPG
ncbi:MAG: hypothetical protein GTO42_01740 [Candidatus Latescibacteria bacterium]|nr:hypothetical protein [Candidatus Latescibacterota bacterium]NIO27253.1 hypothetical protein [Candidatus Latescibacterota bacterium]NIO54777.1 hypothetical protein [Candidatus Latescibacterota bacterium]NIT00860.1 hypothetical protein [Candidatus Latescibacterota bacterium]NIT37783.1 hypothetical protein [Candidatus Latescibacterota bacterium]